MIDKRQLKGKFVTYLDKDSKMRTGLVVRIVGNYLTIMNVVKVKHRIYKDKILGRQYRKRGLEEIKW